MTHPRWRSLARCHGMSSATIRHFPRLVRAMVTGELPDALLRMTRFPRRGRVPVIVRIDSYGIAMTEVAR